MAREAAVRLTLSNGQFVTSMKQSGDVVQGVAQKGKRAMDTFGASADNVRRKVEGIGTAARTASRYALSLGGAFTVGNSIRGALALQTSYRQIAFGAKDARGQMLKAVEVQKIVERSAALTGQANAKMADGFRELMDTSADIEFSRKVLLAVGTTATATGDEISTLTTLADQLNSKFGVGADEMLDTFAQVFDAGKKGGPLLKDFADVMGAVGAELNAAGLEGKEGLNFMLGALVATDQKFRSLPKQVAGLKAVLRGLGEDGELRKLAGKLGLDPKKLINEKDAIARLRRILSTGEKGTKALLGGMREGEEQETMKILFVEPFQKALAEAEKAGLKGKAKIDAALQTFDKGISAMGRAGMDGAALQREADAARKTPEMQLTEALNRLSNAFSKPEIISAIDQLAQSLPKLAEHIASFIAFAAEHPFLAGAGALGAKAGGSALLDIAGSAIGEMLGGGLASGGGSLIKRMLGRKGAGKAIGAAGGALGEAGEVAASGIQRYHQFGMAGGITGEMLGAGGGALSAGELGAAGIPTAGLGATAAAALGVGAAGAAGFGTGYLIADHAYSKEGDVMRELQNANAASAGGGNRDQKRAMLERLRAARSAASKADIGGGALDSFARMFTDVDSRKQANDEIWTATQTILKLQEELKNKPTGGGGGGSHTATTGDVNIVGRVKVDAESSRLIATATTTALGGKILDVRITNARELGFPVSAGPGGSRGPMRAGEPRQGGGV